MPRSLWKGAVSFGLITIPVKLYSATEEKDVSFRQVHPDDGGRIKYKRVCEICGKEIPFTEIAKGYETADGRVVILEKSDFENLPLPSAKAIDIVQFVSEDEIDPASYDKAYYLEADGPGAKPYALLRQALANSGKAAVVKVAVRTRESLALIYAKGDCLMLHTMLWPDEVRQPDFLAPTPEVKVTDAEVAMAQMFIDQLSGTFDPTQYTDSYREALEAVVQSKLSGMPVAEGESEAAKPADVVDLVAALRASVEAAKARREAASQAPGGNSAPPAAKGLAS
ncbi:MAG: Ku protein [Propionibacteriaceae bacterium]|nr:Ku protein [Micropruina sp.]HBX82926.1 Ku protein [Propionibacteriaceae bacterium]HBY23525.1 Ku protein [Propionibacteriaceae bacterium]